MSKLTVESIINIYGSEVKEIKVYNEAKRAKVEAFLQVEPVAFSLSDEPDVLRIYIDKKSSCASLDGTLKENTAKFETQDAEEQVADFEVEYANLVKQLAEDIPGDKLTDTREIKCLLADALPGWDEEDWEDLRAAVEAVSRKKNLPKFKEVRTVSWDEIKTLCIKKGWYTRGTSEQYSDLACFVFDMEEATTEDLVYIASDILEHSDTEYDIEAILWELNRVCNTSFEHE